MLASDKVKLDAFEEAEQYTKAINLPDSVMSNVDVSSEANYIYLKYTKDSLIDGSNSKVKLEIPAATNSAAGVMSANDKKKMNNIPYEVVTYIGVFNNDPSRVDIRCDRQTTGGTFLHSTYYIESATTSIAGVMSASDKVKLDGIEAGAQVNKIESVSVNGTPLEITNKGVNIPIHEYTAGDGINIENGVISTTPISIKTEKFSFVSSGSHQPTYNYSGVAIYDDRYISGTKYGIAFDKSDIQLRTVMTSPDGVRTVCFALNDDIRRKIDNAITSISINNIGQVNTNGAVNLTIPNATPSKDGMMSKEDKTKLDSQPTIKASNATGVTDNDYVVIKKSELDSILSRLSALENKA